MTLEQLRVFVCVAECEHMTRAAETLNLTQSATSAAIAALEERHGVKLFDRIGRRIALTGAGRAFLTEARAVLARAATAEQTLADLAGLNTGELILAASQTIGSYWLPPRIAQFRAAYPGVMIKLRIGNTRKVAALASAGDVDLAFAEGEVSDPGLAVSPIGGDVLVIVAAPKARGLLDGLDVERLTAAPWVAREKGSGTRSAFDAALTAFGVDAAKRHSVLELPSNEAIRAAVEAGAGLAIMSRLVVGASIKAGSLIASPLALPRRGFFLLRHKQRYESQASRAFLGVIESYDDTANGTLPSRRDAEEAGSGSRVRFSK